MENQKFYYLLENVALIGTVFIIFWGSRLFDRMRNEAIRFEIDMLEEEFLYLKGRVRMKVKKAYLKLLKSCGNTLGLDEPIYLKRG